MIGCTYWPQCRAKMDLPRSSENAVSIGALVGGITWPYLFPRKGETCTTIGKCMEKGDPGDPGCEKAHRDGLKVGHGNVQRWDRSVATGQDWTMGVRFSWDRMKTE